MPGQGFAHNASTSVAITDKKYTLFHATLQERNGKLRQKYIGKINTISGFARVE
jgi:hypothetical protein